MRELQTSIDSCARIVIIELSFEEQFRRYLRSLLTLPKDARLHARSGGKSLSVMEVIEAVAVL
ncbi:MAG TPA: hypothetical protein VF215_15970 [Thermoanaerobaculia bacterium]